jgi:spore maturation protein CgeB
MVRLYNRSKIVLNIHAEDHLDTETRVFEALGCGAFVLSEPLSEECPFEPGVHLAVASGINELERSLAFLLSHKEDRLRIAEQGHQAAVERHTYTTRAAQIAALMAQYVRARSIEGPSVDRDAVLAFRRREPRVNLTRLARTAHARISSRLERLFR